MWTRWSSMLKEAIMGNINSLTEAFRVQYERFIFGCDAIEETGAWDKETFGEMGSFFENYLVSLILRLIVADGKISEKEVEYLNRNFAFDYTVSTLTEVYDNCKEAIAGSFDEDFKGGVARLEKINGKLAAVYKGLLCSICDIVIASDGEITPGEINEAKRIKALI